MKKTTYKPRLEGLEDRTMLSVSGVGTFVPSTGTWKLRSTPNAGPADLGTFRYAGQVPVVGDWNGDGKDDIGVFNRATATWSLHYGTSAGEANAGTFQFGPAGSRPVVGDWNGDGRDDIGVYVQATGTWYLRSKLSSGPADVGVFRFGPVSWASVPVVGDWNGDGKDGIGIFNRVTATWALRQTATAGRADAGVFQYAGSTLVSIRMSSGGVVPVVGDWNGDGKDGIGVVDTTTALWSLRQTANAGGANVGTFVFGPRNARPVVGDFVGQAASANEVLTLTLPPLDLDLLGLKVQSSPINVTVSAQKGDGKLLGNVLSTVSDLVDLGEVNDALNNVLAGTVNLLNSLGLVVSGVGDGSFSDAAATTTPVLELFVAPVHLDLLGAKIDTSPIRLSITAQSGQGLVLGNIITELANLFNPPLPDHLDLDFINDRLETLLDRINDQIPGIPAAEVPPAQTGEGQILSLTVPALDVDLLGLQLKTEPITVNAAAQTGDGELLGNLLQTLLNTLHADPAELTRLNNNLNAVLARVVGVLNAATLTLPAGALDPLSTALKTLALPDLVNPTAGASVPLLDLSIASTDGTTPPVDVDLLGLVVTTSDINAQLLATTGDGKVLGNLLYNVANLLNPGGPFTLISLLQDLATGGTKTGTVGSVTEAPSAGTLPATQLLTLTLKPLDLNLLGLRVQSEPITVTISAVEGDGKLLGNLLKTVSTLVNTEGVGNALNNVLGETVDLLNSVALQVSGVLDGDLSSAPDSVTPVLNLSVAPVHLDLLGAKIDTSPIHLTITAEAGDGKVLGNVVTELANLFNPPLPDQLDVDTIIDRLNGLLTRLNQQIPSIGAAPVAPVTLGPGEILSLTVPPIDLNLLGLILKTSPITVNATVQTGNGELVGNLLTTLLNTLNATPAQLSQLNNSVNALLAKVVGVLNASSLVLSGDVLTGVFKTLGLPNLIATTPSASTRILDLIVASQDGTTPPVMVDLLGLLVTTSDINAQLWAQTGDGQILGNLLYNVANLLNPRGAGSLLYLLTQLAG